jgi:uncharacterized protein (TIGR02266 family)
LNATSGTHAVTHVGASRTTPPSARSGALTELQARAAKLEQALAEAQRELAVLRAERDELLARLRMDERVTLPACDTQPAAQADVVLLEAEAPVPLPFEHVESSQNDNDGESEAGPVSLSGLVVSRADRRHETRTNCDFEVAFLGDSHLIAGLSQDISEGGVFVATYQRLEIGSAVTLGLELPSGRVEVKGVVRWARPELQDSEQRPGFGVAFTEVLPEALAALRDFCRVEPARYYEL